MARGHGKGASFERDVCRALSLWVSAGERKDLFWRAAMSGGRATVARKRGEKVHQAGDITAVHAEGHKLTDDVYIECKHYRDLELDSFIVCGTGKLTRFWRETLKKAAQNQRYPMLIAKQNFLPTLVITHSPLWGPPAVKVGVRSCYIYRFDAIIKEKFKWPRSSASETASATEKIPAM